MTAIFASYDVGTKNFSQYIEEVDLNALTLLEKEYKSLPKGLQRKTQGPMNAKIQNILNRVELTGKRIQTGVYDFGGDGNSPLTIATRLNLLYHLEKYKYLWDQCDGFIIEEQYSNPSRGGRKANKAAEGANMKAIKVAEGLFMWILQNYPSKIITSFKSTFKTQIFGAPKMTKTERKKWSTIEVQKLYTKREDVDMINIYNFSIQFKGKRIPKTTEKLDIIKRDCICVSDDAKELRDKLILEKQKLDDVSDACKQFQAYKFKTMVACF